MLQNIYIDNIFTMLSLLKKILLNIFNNNFKILSFYSKSY